MDKRKLIQAMTVASLAPWLLESSAKPEHPEHQAPALLLAKRAPDGLSDVARYLVSEKLDGVRAYWDGNLMYFRSGEPVAVPAWFAARLPMMPLDGELWMGRRRFEPLVAAVRRNKPRDVEWRQIRYMVFELPGGAGSFAERADRLQTIARSAAWDGLQAVPQTRVENAAALKLRLNALVRDGAEGLMLHEADAPYRSGRSELLLKLKPEDDDEAVVLAHLPGNGKYAGMLGGLQVRNDEGQVFVLGTGFSDAQRRSPTPIGSTVTYRFGGQTAKGQPRFASFLRLQSL